MVASEANYRKALAKIDELENRLFTALADVARGEEELKTQAAETHTMGEASMEIRTEDVQQLADYKKTNTKLLEFVEKIAQGRTKHKAEAKALLGT